MSPTRTREGSPKKSPPQPCPEDPTATGASRRSLYHSRSNTRSALHSGSSQRRSRRFSYPPTLHGSISARISKYYASRLSLSEEVLRWSPNRVEAAFDSLYPSDHFETHSDVVVATEDNISSAAPAKASPAGDSTRECRGASARSMADSSSDTSALSVACDTATVPPPNTQPDTQSTSTDNHQLTSKLPSEKGCWPKSEVGHPRPGTPPTTVRDTAASQPVSISNSKPHISIFKAYPGSKSIMSTSSGAPNLFAPIPAAAQGIKTLHQEGRVSRGTRPKRSRRGIKPSKGAEETPFTKNTAELVKIEESFVTVVEARKCEHRFVQDPQYYGHPLCPICRMTVWLEMRRLMKIDIAETGRVRFKEQIQEPQTSNEAAVSALGYANTYISTAKKNLKKRSHPGAGADNTRSDSWNGLKAQIANMATLFEEMVEYELKFERQNLVALLENRGGIDTTAQKALAIYHSAPEEEIYLVGDPASPDYIRSKHCEENLGKSTDPEERPARRRKLSKDDHITWNEEVKVSATHVVLASNSENVMTLADYTMKHTIGDQSTRQIGSTVTGLERPSRHRACMKRTGVVAKGHGKNVVLETPVEHLKYRHYQPGVWQSPEGYEKAETSWANYTWDEMELGVNPAIEIIGSAGDEMRISFDSPTEFISLSTEAVGIDAMGLPAEETPNDLLITSAGAEPSNPPIIQAKVEHSGLLRSIYTMARQYTHPLFSVLYRD